MKGGGGGGGGMVSSLSWLSVYRPMVCGLVEISPLLCTETAGQCSGLPPLPLPTGGSRSGPGPVRSSCHRSYPIPGLLRKGDKPTGQLRPYV